MLRTRSPPAFPLDPLSRSSYSSNAIEANLLLTSLGFGSRDRASDRSTERMAVIGRLSCDSVGLPGAGIG